MKTKHDQIQDESNEEQEEQELSVEELWETEGGAVNPVDQVTDPSPGSTSPTSGFRFRFWRR